MGSGARTGRQHDAPHCGDCSCRVAILHPYSLCARRDGDSDGGGGGGQRHAPFEVCAAAPLTAPPHRILTSALSTESTSFPSATKSKSELSRSDIPHHVKIKIKITYFKRQSDDKQRPFPRSLSRLLRSPFNAIYEAKSTRSTLSEVV